MAEEQQQQQQKPQQQGNKKLKYIEVKKKHTRGILRKEIDALKGKVREAYAIGAKIEDGQEVTKEERKLVQDQPLNNQLIDKLEKMYLAQKSATSNNNENSQHQHNENMSQTSEQRRGSQSKSNQIKKNDHRTWPGYVNFIKDETMTMLHFFYLVRLAQQGFFYLISGAYPTLEPQAITYLADKIIGTSIYAGRSQSHDRVPHLKSVSILVQNLMTAKDEPVAEGFKTTYKQIMNIIYHLMDQTLNEEQSKNKQGGGAEGSVPKAATQPTTAIPPIWVVMPYSSMIDNQTFAMPGAVPTLPYPSTILPNGFIPPNAVPFLPKPNPVDEIRQLNKESTEKKEELEEETNEEEEEQVVKQEEEEEVEQHNNYYDDDRFADPDMSDYEDYDEEEDDEEEEEVKEEVKEGEPPAAKEEKTATQKVDDGKWEDDDVPEPSTATTTTTTTITNNDQQAASKANSSWLNFVASSPIANTESNSSSRSNRSNNQPYHKNKKY